MTPQNRAPRYRRPTPAEREAYAQWQQDSSRGVKTPLPEDSKNRQSEKDSRRRK